MSKVGLEVALRAVEDAPEVDGLLVHVEGAAGLREPRAPVVLGIVLEHARTPGALEMRLPRRAVRKVIFNVAQGEHPLTSWAGRLLTLIVTLPLHVLNEIYGEIGLELAVFERFSLRPALLSQLLSGDRLQPLFLPDQLVLLRVQRLLHLRHLHREVSGGEGQLRSLTGQSSTIT